MKINYKKINYKLTIPFAIAIICFIANLFVHAKVDSNGIATEPFIFTLVAYLSLFFGIAQLIVKAFCKKFQQK